MVKTNENSVAPEPKKRLFGGRRAKAEAAVVPPAAPEVASEAVVETPVVVEAPQVVETPQAETPPAAETEPPAKKAPRKRAAPKSAAEHVSADVETGVTEPVDVPSESEAAPKAPVRRRPPLPATSLLFQAP
ncbi:MAG: hypothetical protein QOK08_1567, partial [Actinomycetota bacterium]|nr:hypothetical protein [Actinomycetota bacterium]